MKILKLLFLGIFTTFHWLLFCNFSFNIMFNLTPIDSYVQYILFHLAIGMVLIPHIYFYIFTYKLFPKKFQLEFTND